MRTTRVVLTILLPQLCTFVYYIRMCLQEEECLKSFVFRKDTPPHPCTMPTTAVTCVRTDKRCATSNLCINIVRFIVVEQFYKNKCSADIQTAPLSTHLVTADIVSTVNWLEASLPSRVSSTFVTGFYEKHGSYRKWIFSIYYFKPLVTGLNVVLNCPVSTVIKVFRRPTSVLPKDK